MDVTGGLPADPSTGSRPDSSKSGMSRVEEFLQAESRLGQIEKPQPLEGETKAKYSWRLIRHCVRHAINLMERANVKDMMILHGIHHTRRLNHPYPVTGMIYNRQEKEYYTVDGRMVRIFREDGRRRDILSLDESVNKLIYAAMLNLFVGWHQDQDHLMLLNSEMQATSTSHASGPITAAVYNASIGEVVTVGRGFLISWVFRYGGRHLLPRKTVQEGLDSKEYYSMLVLEDTASHSQRAYAASGNSVMVVNLYEGRILSVQHDLHVRTITAVTFFNPLKYLITGAKDGSIKVWDETWHLQLVFVGHGGAVSSLSVYPYGPLIMSGSHDNTMRVWSMETCDQVDVVRTSDPAVHIGTLINRDNLFTMSDTHVDLWTVQHVHTLHTTVGNRVWHIKSTDHPHYPMRSILLCQDASIRIISPPTGDVITSLLMNTQHKLVDAAYAIAEGLLFAVYSNGIIVKASTKMNPCQILDRWRCNERTKACNCLLVYEYVITTDSPNARMPNGSNNQNPVVRQHSVNRTLLLGGRKDGNICVFNWETGHVDFHIEAHGTRGVLSIIANSRNDQVISSGLDNIIKVWRLYPYASESLAPLMSFYCAHSPVSMTVMCNKLSVAFQEPVSATYSIVMYNLGQQNRSDHAPEDDHMDDIIGMSACPKMKITASTSVDGTLRIWNENNNLIRVIKLNVIPHSLAFCSRRGDLLLGIGDHLHKIAYRKYLPQAYCFKMVSMQFLHEEAEKPLPFNDNLLNTMSRDDVKRLKAARSSFKFTHFIDVLTEAENEEVMREKKVKEKEFSRLGDRDSELLKIRDGDLSARHKPKKTASTKREAFDKYLKIFYNRPELNLYPDEPFLEDLVRKQMNKPQEEEVKEDKWKPELEPVGFFPPSSEARLAAMDSLPIPIKTDGFVPNSVLVRLLWPRDVIEERIKKEEYRPPQLTEDQLAHFNKKVKSQNAQKNKTKLKREESSFRDTTFFMDYGDDEEDKSAKEEEEEEKPAESAFMSKMQQMMTKSPEPEPEPEPVEEEPERKVPVVKRGPLTEPKPQHLAQPLPQREPRPTKPVTKLVSKPPAPQPPLVRIPRAPAPRSPSPPPPPPTPLPEFIAQFIGNDWFDLYFPNCNTATMPKPWTVASFVTMLARLVRVAEYAYKVEVVKALQKLYEDHKFSGSEVPNALMSVFNHHSNPPSCLDPDQRNFIQEALQLLQALGTTDRDFYAELMVAILDGDKDIRHMAMNMLKNCGLRDPHGFLGKELDSWDVWSLEDQQRASAIRKLCHDWLDRWLSSFKIHLQDTIQRLKRGQNVHGRIPSSRVSGSTSPKGILKKGEMPVDDVTHQEGVQFVPRPPGGSSSARQITVSFDQAPDVSTIDNATYMDGINYFCDMELERSLQRGPGRSRKPKSDKNKNTVLVLPQVPGKQCLVRLGETHTSSCRPHRETGLAVADLKFPPVTTRGHQPAPGQVYGFPSCINLPLKTVYMNPFHSPLDDLELLNTTPVLLTLKTSQKYFVPSRSYLTQTQDTC